jgi:hypothetical protein
MSVPLPPLRSAELALIPAAPESELAAALDRRLPQTAPPAPWRCRVDGFVWIQRSGSAAPSVLPAPLQSGPSARWVIGVIGACLHYTDSPVGPYSEVYAALLVRTGYRLVAHIPFMAVDSLDSIRGGRANWALPKTLATFEGTPSACAALRVEGTGWHLDARSRPFGPRLPVRIALPCAQVRPDQAIGRYKATIAGPARLSRVEVDVASDASLRDWMPSGRHIATQWSNASLTVAAPVDGTADTPQRFRRSRPRP